MREPKNQMLGTMEPPLMQLSVKNKKKKPKTKQNKNKTAITLFEIFLALHIKNVDDNDDNNNSDYHISSVSHHHQECKFVLVVNKFCIHIDNITWS